MRIRAPRRVWGVEHCVCIIRGVGSVRAAVPVGRVGIGCLGEVQMVIRWNRLDGCVYVDGLPWYLLEKFDVSILLLQWERGAL